MRTKNPAFQLATSFKCGLSSQNCSPPTARPLKFQKKNLKTEKIISLVELSVLIISVIAFAWMIGGEFKVVKADDTECSAAKGTCMTGNSCPSGYITAGANNGLICGTGEICCKQATTCTGAGGQCIFSSETCSTSLIIGSFSDCPSPKKCCKFELTTPPATQTQSSSSSDSSGRLRNSVVSVLGLYPTIKDIGKDLGILGKSPKNSEQITNIMQTEAGPGVPDASVIDLDSPTIYDYDLGLSGDKLTGFSKYLKNKGYTYGSDGVVYGGEGQFAGTEALSQTEAQSLLDQYVGSQSNWLDDLLRIDPTKSGWSNTLSSFVNSVVYSAIAAAAYYLIFKYIVKASDRNMDYLLTGTLISAAIGIVGGTLIGSLIPSLSSNAVGWISAAITLVAVGLYTLFGYQEYSQEVFSYMPLSWQPATGGKNCDACNKLRYGCSEYQCHSFGTACNITNAGTKNEMCAWQNKGDITGPEIIPMQSVLEKDYFYKPLNVVAPPDKGVKIIYNGIDKDANLCIPPFTDLILGVQTNEIAHCKIDIVKQNNLTDMISEMSEGFAYIYNHTIFLPSSALPSQSALNNSTIVDDNGNNFTLNAGQDKTFYIRCEDINGNPSPYNFLMQFCVQQGPDTMAPIIKGTNYLNTTNYISFNTQQAYLQVYTNEPADCRWDIQDVAYNDMLYNMSKCSQNLNNFFLPSTLTYGCETNLTGIKNYEDNDYFIKCKDQPWLKNTVNEVNRNTNKVSYKLTLKGTYDLAIENVSVNSKPNNTIVRDSANQTQVVLRVNTAGGAQEGLAKCQYNLGGNWNFFYNDGSMDYLIENSQKLFLTPGTYNYPLRCIDIGGNLAYSSVGFTIQQDVFSPSIDRVYYEEEKIKLITDEEAECVYSITGCGYEFADGAQMLMQDNFNHFIDWTTETDLSIKCKDSFGNKPLYDKCSIVVRGSQF